MALLLYCVKNRISCQGHILQTKTAVSLMHLCIKKHFYLYPEMHFGLSLNALVITTATSNCTLKLNLGLMPALPHCNTGQWILKVTCK